jgi:ComF family protein
MIGMWVIQRLLDILFETRATETLVAKATEAELFQLLQPSPLLNIPGTALLSYRKPLVRALITEAKFHENEKAILLLSLVLASYLEEELAEHLLTHKEPLTIVPVPLSKRRMRERGYNQVERMVRVALSQVTEPHARISYLLTRTRDTRPQTQLRKSERLENVRGAFTTKESLYGTSVLLIDDVTTTGATLTEARKALETAGATQIQVLSLAH